MKRELKIGYSENGLFKHPETIAEFKALQEYFITCKENNDIQGMYLTAFQLFPDYGKEVDSSEEEG